MTPVSRIRSRWQQFLNAPPSFQLELGERRFRALIQASAQIVWVTDPEGRCIEDSPSWRHFTGMTYEQFHGSGWIDALHPDDQARAARVWGAAVRTKARYDIVYRLRHHTGEWRHTRARGIPMLAINGDVQCWVGLNDDITEKVKAEAALAESELQFRTLACSVPNFIWIADAEAQVHYWNDAWYEYTGRTPTESYGIRAAEAIEEAHRVSALEAWLNAVREGQQLEIEIPLRRRDGVYRWFVARARPMRDEAGQVYRWCGVIFDVDDHRRALEELRSEREDRERFVCALVHDLKNNVATIRSVAEQLIDGRLSADERASFVALWKKAASRADRMIEDLLDANQVQAGQSYRIKSLEWIDVSTLIRDCVSAAGAPFETRVTAGLRARWSGMDISRVMQNLLSNAVKYGDSSRPMTVQSSPGRDPSRVLISVHNWGRPIPDADLDQIFGFLKRGPTGGQRGWGIGLTLVRGLVEAHGGTISVTSSVESGTRFTVNLPVEARLRPH